MTNPYHNRSGHNTFAGPNFSMYRRSSYASVAAGRSNTLPRSDSNDSNNSTPQQRTTSQQSRGMDIQGVPGVSTRGGLGSESWERVEEMGVLDEMGYPRLFVPSYLKHSRYAERLKHVHRARLQGVRDARIAYLNQSGPGSLSTSSSSVNLHKMSSSHTHKTPAHDAIERLPPLGPEDDLKGLPTKLNETDKWPGLEILADGTEIRFQGVTKTPDEAASIRSDLPMPKDAGIYYFEVTILSKGKEGLIGVGFSGSKATLSRLPGWESDSWGYHGDDGFSFSCSAVGKTYGPRFAGMDVIGCGVNFKTGTGFFTKNGINLGDTFSELNVQNEPLYPTVGIKKLGEHLRVNFGQTPFVFDIDSMMDKQRDKIKAEIDTTVSSFIYPSLDESSIVQELVSQYFAHEGYVETGRAFMAEVHDQKQSLRIADASASPMEPIDDINAVNRQKIRAAILDGDIDKAFKYIDAYYPGLFDPEENHDIYFALRCRKFIEMIAKITGQSESTLPPLSSKSGGGKGDTAQRGDYDSDVFDHQMELDDQLQRESRGSTIQSTDPAENDRPSTADSMDTTPDSLKPTPTSPGQPTIMTDQNSLDAIVQYGQALMIEWQNDRGKQRTLTDIFALIAYTNARDSVVGELIDDKGRVVVAEHVNGAILVSLGGPRSALLENLCAQTGAMIDMMAEDGGAAAFVNVQKDYLQ